MGADPAGRLPVEVVAGEQELLLPARRRPPALQVRRLAAKRPSRGRIHGVPSPQPTAMTTSSIFGRLPLAIAAFWLTALVVTAAQGETEKPVRPVEHFNLGKNALALAGYDPVSYFAEGGGKPTKGRAEHELVHQGVRYRFAKAANLKLFEQSPAKFEPAYGGWCAYAMAEKQKVEVDPESFLIQDGRLMVFYKGWFNDTRAKFKKDPANLTRKADANWAEILTPPKPK
jgi:YHS domain-containing protein